MKRRHLICIAATAFLTAAAVQWSQCEEPGKPYYWQQSTDAIDPRNARADSLGSDALAGLNFEVRLDREELCPRLTQEIAIDTGRHQTHNYDHSVSPHASRRFSPVDLGMVMPLGGVNLELVDCYRTWCASVLHIAYEDSTGILDLDKEEEAPFQVIVSRLTPAVLMRMKSDAQLLAGEKFVGTAAYPTLYPNSAPNLPAAAARTSQGFGLPAYAAAGGGKVVIKPVAECRDLPLEGLDRGWLLFWFAENSYFDGITEADANYSLDGPSVKQWKKCVFRADMPLLVLFSAQPGWISQSEDGDAIEIGFTEEGWNQVVVLPLFGASMPSVEETRKWASGLPEDVTRRCDWWAAHMRKFPIDAIETYDYESATDTTIIRESFKFIEFRDSGAVAAPVPPLMATAFIEGFPIEFSHPPHDPEMITSVGSYMAVSDVESYEMRIRGLQKYAQPRPVPKAGAPDHLLKIVNDEVRKITATGHLAPWMCMMKNIWGHNFTRGTLHLVHANPGETLYLLSEALPFLDPALREEAIAYMRRERTEYPPETAGIQQGHIGNRREAYALSPVFLSPAVQNPGLACNNINYAHFENFYVRNGLIPPETLYHLAAYYAAVGDEGLREAWPSIQTIHAPYLARADWATGGTFRWPGQIRVSQYRGYVPACPAASDSLYGMGGVVDVNNRFAALLGHIRLASMAEDKSAEVMARGLFARTAALRFALGKMAGHLYRRKIMTLPQGSQEHVWYRTCDNYWLAMESPEEDIRPVHALDEFGMLLAVKDTVYYAGGGPTLVLMRDAVPELGAFCREYLRPETERYYSRYESNIPHWYFAWCDTSLAGECTNARVWEGYQAFLSHAWVLDATPRWLEQHLDVPWHPRGDLFYLHKVIETIRAYCRAE